jgi:hypothetical protein
VGAGDDRFAGIVQPDVEEIDGELVDGRTSVE